VSWIDAHCHLELREYPNTAEVLERAKAAGLRGAVIVGQFHGPGDFGTALQVARAHPDFLAPTMGIHPHEAARPTKADWDELERLCAEPEVRAVGEAGLDYYYDHSPRPEQREGFARQCALAKRLNKPLVVHVRDAHEECADILAAEKVERGVIHCFTGDTVAARRYLDPGFYISLSGILTYKRTEALQDAAKFCPLDRLMVETDSPYLTPIPHRGKRNEPMHVALTGQKLAELRGVPVDVIAQATSANAASVFSLRG
jgi:TatD DNase family protein